MPPFVSEGDGPLAFVAHSKISKLHAAIACGHCSKVFAVAQNEVSGKPLKHSKQIIFVILIN